MTDYYVCLEHLEILSGMFCEMDKKSSPQQNQTCHVVEHET